MPDLTPEEARDAVLNAMHEVAIDADASDQGPATLAIVERVMPPLDAYAAAVRRDTLAQVRETLRGLEGAAPNGVHGYLVTAQDGPWIDRRAALDALEG